MTVPKFVDLTNSRYGRLLVIRRATNADCGLVRWFCVCDCGKERVILGQSLRNGDSSSCGCVQKELMGYRPSYLRHGESPPERKSKEYSTWASMLSRCYNPNATGFMNYGGRGIAVCDLWRNSYASFLDDMGRRPSPQHTIDRFPNNDGNYEPSNCRWATKKEQRANQRKKV